MPADGIPTFGYFQPRYGMKSKIFLLAMGKDGKRGPRAISAPAKRMRKILATNLAALIERDYPAVKFKTESDRQKKVAEDAGVSWSSIQRQLDPDDGKTLDVMADLAVAFHLKVHELLNPDLATLIAQGKLNDPPADVTGAA